MPTLSFFAQRCDTGSLQFLFEQRELYSSFLEVVTRVDHLDDDRLPHLVLAWK
jgi:hypothetical protein